MFEEAQIFICKEILWGGDPEEFSTVHEGKLEAAEANQDAWESRKTG